MTFFVDWLVAFFNLTFTTFAITSKSVFDKNIKGFGKANTRTLEIYAYFYGQEERLFNVKKLLLWFAGGIFESTLLFFFIYWAYNFSGFQYGFEMDYESLNMLMFSVIIIYLNNKVIFLTHVYTLL